MDLVDKVPAATQSRGLGKYIKLRILLSFAIVDSLSVWLLILLYISGVDLVWLVNVNFSVMSALLIIFSIQRPRLTFFGMLFAATLLISILKIVLFLDDSRSFQWTHFLTYFQGLLIPISAISFASQFGKNEFGAVLDIFSRFARIFLWIVLPGMTVYTALYFTGHISYFGMGTNLYYAYPFLAMRNTAIFSAGFFLVALISGKRALIITALSQIFLRNFNFFRKSKIQTLLMGGAFLMALQWIYYNSDLLFRFQWLLDADFDFSDPYFLSISGGGRFEEIFGIYDYFRKYPLDLLFGAPPGSYYIWTLDWSDYVATKNYSHITWIGYVFRYGLFFSLPLLIYFGFLFVRNLGSDNPFYIAFGGIFVVSLFGALLVADPTSWILIGLFIYLKSKQRICRT